MKTHNTQDKTKATAAYYWRHALKYPGAVVGVLVTIPLTVLVNTYLPALIMANVLSKLSQHHYVNHQIWRSFGPELVAYITLMLFGMLTWRFVDFFMWQVEKKVERDIAEEVFNHLLDQSADFHANNFTGSLVSQNSKLLGGYIRVADTTIFQVYPLFAGIIIASAILLGRAPLYVILLLLFATIYIVNALLVTRPVRRLSQDYATAESKQTGYLADALTNSMAVKSFAGGDYERARFHKTTGETQDHLSRFARAHSFQSVYLGLPNRIISSMALFVAVVSVMVFHANIGTVFLILSYTSSIVDQLFSFGNNSLRNYNRAFGDASDMVEILAQKPTIQDPAEPETSQMLDGAITLSNVGFSHQGVDEALFQKLNLQIKPGEKVGLVGHSGSGKTTFTRLLLRFSDVDSGEILIDGQNIAHVTQDDLHRAIAYVPQEPIMFHRSLQDNIRYGKPEATDSEVVAAAKVAHADEFIVTQPKGYKTLVGERGVKLSGGQRQRIAIARAMLKDAPILLLDEATSALDSESEALIQDALWKLMEGRTAIVIAHRLSTIQHMDRIVVLDNGKVVEQGSHKELIGAGGTYASLWARQSGGFLEDDE
jgi:ATP-binding cassette subfamily B protein